MKNKILFFLILACSLSYGQNIVIENKEKSSKLSSICCKKIVFIDKYYNDFHLKIDNSKNLEITSENPNFIMKGNVRIDIINSENIVVNGLNFASTKGDLIRIIDSKDIVLNTLSFNGCGSYQTGSIVRIEGETSNVTIEESYFDDNRSMGINIVSVSEKKYPSDIKILNNKFMNIKDVKHYYPNSNGNGLECIVIGRGYYETMYLSLDVLVQGNYFENIIGDNNEVISIKSSKNLIKNNFFKACVGALTCRVGEGNILADNTFVNGKKAIRIFGKDHIIKNNTFRNNNVAVELKYGDYSNEERNLDNKYNQVENLLITNNLFINNKENIKTITKDSKYNPIKVKTIDNKYQ